MLASLTASYKVTATNVDTAILTTTLSSSASSTQLQSSLASSYSGLAASPATVTTVTPTATPASGSAACFAGTELVTLESGDVKAMADVRVGDRVLSVNAQGEAVFSDVVYVPHGLNNHHATFAQIGTESGRDLKMTMNHILPAGSCAAPVLSYVAAASIAVGDCVQTVSGREQVVSVGKVEGQGIYTIVAMEELIVVNGIVATPFGGVNPTLANIYYNLHRLWYTARGGGLLGTGRWLQGAIEALYHTAVSV